MDGVESKTQYEKVPTCERDAPPAYAKAHDEESHVIVADEELAAEGCTPGRLCLASTLAAFFCFWPAALVGMYASMRARYANNDRAVKYLRVGKKFVWASFIVGAIIMVVVAAMQIGVTMHMAKKAYRGAMRGYIAGLDAGLERGRNDAMSVVMRGYAAKFPERVPGTPDVFDISGPFWSAMRTVESSKEAGKIIGYSFGLVDGYKKGFCSTEHTDCRNVGTESLGDYLVQCPRMRAKMERMMRKYQEHKMEEEAEEHRKHKGPAHSEMAEMGFKPAGAHDVAH